jgi:hypothetical protein
MRSPNTFVLRGAEQAMKTMQVELQFADKAPETQEAQRVIITYEGHTFEIHPRRSGLYVCAAYPIQHVLLVMPMGTNGVVLFNREEP